ncbi:hypothetical protein ACO1O0_007629 [Amphichorda felina]
MPDIEDQVQRRRERGRRSQAAFRKRQAQANKDLAEENERLKEAIRKVLATSRAGARPELLDTIHDLADVAGIDTNEPKAGHVVTEPINGGMNAQAVARGFSQEYDQHSSPSYSTPDLTTAPRRICETILPNPFHYTRISLPPYDIMPYLGPGSTAFSGLIFWSLMDHCVAVECKATHSKPSLIIQRGLGHSKATRDINPLFIQAMVEARMEYKKTGSIGPKYAAAAERDLSVAVYNQVRDDYRARGKDAAQWLSCMAIEKRVRSLVGSEVFGLLERAAGGQGDSLLCELMDNLKCALYDSSICFGDGPRWNINVVDELFLDCIGTALRLA